MWKASAQSEDRHSRKQTVLIVMSHGLKVSPSPYCSSCLELPSDSVFCLYITFRLDLFPESPPTFKLHKCSCPLLDQWAYLNKFEQASEDCRQTEDREEEKVLRVKAEIAVVLIPLFFV